MFYKSLLLFSVLIFIVGCSKNPQEIKITHKTIQEINVKEDELVNKNFSDLTFEELEHNKKIHIKNNLDKYTLIRNLERMLSLCKQEEKICALRLELADLYFDIENLERANVLYHEFVKSYPGNFQAEYAKYKEIISTYKQSFDAERDQTKTKEALNLAQGFISKAKNAEYLKEAKDIVTECKKKLLQSEMNVFYFYLKRRNFISAQKRIDFLKKDFFKNQDNKIIKALEEDLKLSKENKKYYPLDIETFDELDIDMQPIKRKTYVKK